MLLRSLIHNFLLHQHHLITLLAVMEPDAVGNNVLPDRVEDTCAGIVQPQGDRTVTETTDDVDGIPVKPGITKCR